MTTHKVNDLLLAAYLVVKGFTCRDIKPDKDRLGMLLFYFEEEPGLIEEAHKFRNKKALVEPRKYSETLRVLRNGGSR